MVDIVAKLLDQVLPTKRYAVQIPSKLQEKNSLTAGNIQRLPLRDVIKGDTEREKHKHKQNESMSDKNTKWKKKEITKKMKISVGPRLTVKLD